MVALIKKTSAFTAYIDALLYVGGLYEKHGSIAGAMRPTVKVEDILFVVFDGRKHK